MLSQMSKWPIYLKFFLCSIGLGRRAKTDLSEADLKRHLPIFERNHNARIWLDKSNSLDALDIQRNNYVLGQTKSIISLFM